MQLISLIVLASLVAGPAAAQDDWPTPDTPKLETSALGITVSVPAPEWIDRAAHDKGYESADGIETSWFIPGGFDSRGNSVTVVIAPIDGYMAGSADRHADYYDPGTCETAARPRPERIPRTIQSIVLCGRDFGTGQGVVFYGITLRASDDAVAVDVWYKSEVPAFIARDEANLPMTPDAVLAMAARIAAAITVSGP